jgi:hypothetical protein
MSGFAIGRLYSSNTLHYFRLMISDKSFSHSKGCCKPNSEMLLEVAKFVTDSIALPLPDGLGVSLTKKSGQS